jgi:hypothetical protein
MTEMTAAIRGAFRIVEEVLCIVQAAPQDTTWTRYEDWEAAVADLRDHVERLRRSDLSRLSDLRLLFAPTASLQELAISNGWSGSYMSLAKRFDELSLG